MEKTIAGPTKQTAPVCLLNTPMPATATVASAQPKRLVSSAEKQSQKTSMAVSAWMLSGCGRSESGLVESTSQSTAQEINQSHLGNGCEMAHRTRRFIAKTPARAANIPMITLTSRQKRMSSARPNGFSKAKVTYSKPGLYTKELTSLGAE